MLRERSQGQTIVRAACIGVLALLLGAFYIEFHEEFLGAGNVGENNPPVGAVGLYFVILFGSMLIQWVRPRWGLTRPELLVIYAMLITFFPIASQGLWVRFVGLTISLPKTGKLGIVEEMPDYFYPRGRELLKNPAFSDKRGGTAGWTTRRATPQRIERGGKEISGVLLTASAGRTALLEQRVPRFAKESGKREAPMHPAEKFWITALVRARDFDPGRTRATLSVSADGETWTELSALNKNTVPTIEFPDSYLCMGSYNFSVPYDLKDGLRVRLMLEGRGRLEVARVRCFGNDSLFRLMEGTEETDAKDLHLIPEGERARLIVRPSGQWSGRTVLYYLRSYIPWTEWARPLAFWALVWVGLFLGMCSLGTIIFRQWSDGEKMNFPLTIFPLEITKRDEASGRVVFDFLRSGAMWAGAGLAIFQISLNGFHFYNANVPGIPISFDLGSVFTNYPWKAMTLTPFMVKLALFAIAIAFFMNTEMAFNLWLFYLLGKVLLLIAYYQGVSDKTLWTGGPPYPYFEQQMIGASVLVAFFSLYLGRKHLGLVLRKALKGDPAVDDSNEPMSYRSAVLGIVGSALLFAAWGHLAKAGWWFGLLALGYMLLLGFVGARIRAECGAPGMWIIPYYAYLLFDALGGVWTFGPVRMAYVRMFGWMCAGYFLLTMPGVLESFQIAKLGQVRLRTMQRCLWIGFLVMVAAGGYALLGWGYAQGQSNMPLTYPVEQDWYMGDLTTAPNTALQRETELQRKLATEHRLTRAEEREAADLKQQRSVSFRRVSPVVTGFTVAGVLAVLRLVFLRFPFHPLGYLLWNTYFMHYFWFSVFVAWLVKATALKLGGVRMVREKLQPFFIGILVGTMIAATCWDLFGVWWLATGHVGGVYSFWF